MVWRRGPWEWFFKRCMVLENGRVESFHKAPIGSHWGTGWVLWVWLSSALEPRSRCVSKIGYHVTLTRISSSFWRESKACAAHGHVWVCPAEGSHFRAAQLICRPCCDVRVDDGDRHPCLPRDSASQDWRRSPTGWQWRYSGLQTSVPANNDGTLSGQTDQPSGLRACAQGRWTISIMLLLTLTVTYLLGIYFQFFIVRPF